MRPAFLPLTLPLASLLFGPVQAQDKPWDLVGQVVSIENGEEQPIKLARVKLTVREFLRSGLTDDQGLFLVQMPAVAKPGQEVILLHNKDNYEIFSPYRGAQRLPAPGPPPPVIEIRMLPKGSKRWWKDELIDAYAERERSRSAQQLAKEQGSRFDPEASLRELAAYAGFTEDEVRGQLAAYINRARKETEDRHRRANAEFLARHYRLAGELYLEAADGLKRAGVEHLRLGAYE